MRTCFDCERDLALDQFPRVRGGRAPWHCNYCRTLEVKRCLRCLIVKPLEGFGPQESAHLGRKAVCKACRLDIYQPGSTRASNLKRLYGLTVDGYELMYDKQGGRCAICFEHRERDKVHHSLHVDHSHKTGEVRELLCGSCNNGLGRFKDDPERLRRAADYLEEHGA